MTDGTIMTIVFCSVFGLFGLVFGTAVLTDNLIKYHWFPHIFEKRGKLWYDCPYWIWAFVNSLYVPLFCIIPWYWAAYTVLRAVWKTLGIAPRVIYIGWAYKDGEAEIQFKRVWPQLKRIQKYDESGIPLAPSERTI